MCMIGAFTLSGGGLAALLAYALFMTAAVIALGRATFRIVKRVNYGEVGTEPQFECRVAPIFFVWQGLVVGAFLLGLALPVLCSDRIGLGSKLAALVMVVMVPCLPCLQYYAIRAIAVVRISREFVELGGFRSLRKEASPARIAFTDITGVDFLRTSYTIHLVNGSTIRIAKSELCAFSGYGKVLDLFRRWHCEGQPPIIPSPSNGSGQRPGSEAGQMRRLTEGQPPIIPSSSNGSGQRPGNEAGQMRR